MVNLYIEYFEDFKNDVAEMGLLTWEEVHNIVRLKKFKTVSNTML